MGGFNIGSIFSGLGKVASVAAPFIPGPWGKVASLVGGIGGMADAQHGANAAAGGTNQLSQEMAGQYNRYSPSVIKAQLTNGGINPETGAYDPNYNPAQNLHDTLFGDKAISDRATSLFDPRQIQPEMAAYKGNIAGAYDNAVGSEKADATNRGFGGYDSALDSNIGATRRGEAANQTGFNANLLTTLFNQKRAYTENQQNQGHQLLETGMEDRNRNLTGAEGELQGGAQGAIGGFGGLRGFYQNNADNAAKGVGDAVEGISKGGFSLPGIFGQILKRRQSNSLGTTNAQGGTPAPNYQGGATDFSNSDTGNSGVEAQPLDYKAV